MGLALVAAPWTTGYQSGHAVVSSIACGILVMVLAVWEMSTDREFATWWNEHMHHPPA